MCVYVEMAVSAFMAVLNEWRLKLWKVFKAIENKQVDVLKRKRL